MKLILQTALLALLTVAPFASANAYLYKECTSHVRQFIGDKSPAAQAEIKQLCAANNSMTIICGLDFRHELPALMQTPSTYKMALEICRGDTEQVVNCTRSTLFEGPRNAPVTVLQPVVRHCRNNT